MRTTLAALPLLTLLVAPPAQAQVSVQLATPGLSIGINVPTYPELVPVPGYPVYYDPRGDSNYFFYSGSYWVFANDRWYRSGWYNGPWQPVSPAYVPTFVLRVPVRYYHRPPPWFRGWHGDAPPRWGERWGRDWEHRHAGWDHWDRRAVPPPAPLPRYQREYYGDRYPHAREQQVAITSRHGHGEGHGQGHGRGPDHDEGHGHGDGHGHGRGEHGRD